VNVPPPGLVNIWAPPADRFVSARQFHDSLAVIEEGLMAMTKHSCRIEGMVGDTKPMLDVYATVMRVAATRSTVLIQGETGAGKELIARAIHRLSPRAHRPFVAIDCRALPESLLESELFGHDGGTCFLDGVAELSPCVQAKLLRVVQQHEVRRVSGTESGKVDVRIIAATNKSLGTLVALEKFREDLFYRLSVVTIAVPPLRERREDIPLLANHFLRRFAVANRRTLTEISPAALALMVGYDWPGNVRELEHVVERAVTLTGNAVLRPDDLPPKLAGEGPAADSSLSLRGVVTRHVRSVLTQARWNRKLAAQLLGIHRRTLYRLTKRYGIPLESARTRFADRRSTR
jgi:two-component system, NtrC family, response regulator AtoC